MFGDGSKRLASKCKDYVIADHLFPATTVMNWRSRTSSRLSTWTRMNWYSPGLYQSSRLTSSWKLPRICHRARQVVFQVSPTRSLLKRIVQTHPRATLKRLHHLQVSYRAHVSLYLEEGQVGSLSHGPGKTGGGPFQFRLICFLD